MRFEQEIQWHREQRKNARWRLKGFRSGDKIEFNGRDVTDWWIEKFRSIITTVRLNIE
jgi:hypothetical protein